MRPSARQYPFEISPYANSRRSAPAQPALSMNSPIARVSICTSRGQRGKRAHGKCAHALYRSGHGAEGKAGGPEMIEIAKMFDDWNVSPEKCGVHRASSVVNIVDIQGIDANQFRVLIFEVKS